MLIATILLISNSFAQGIVDVNNNQQSDVWEQQMGATGLLATRDEDGDGFTNAAESIAGTHPLNPNSLPSQLISLGTGTIANVQWPSLLGKNYRLEFSSALGLGSNPWQVIMSVKGTGSLQEGSYILPGTRSGFFRVQVSELDTDSDGVSDWEELTLGFDPTKAATDRYTWLATTNPVRSADYNRIATGLQAGSQLSAVVVDSAPVVGWPDPGVIIIKRSGGLKALSIPIVIGGTAVRGTDYDTTVGANVVIPAGAREAVVEFTPRSSSTITTPKTITLTIQSSSAYTLGTATGTVNLGNRPAGDKPSAKAAARFLVQASFGANETEIARVQSLGFEGWIDDQLSRPIGLHKPGMIALDNEIRAENPTDPNNRAWSGDYAVPWWTSAMSSTATADPLRQRMAFALSQILVISDRVDTIGFYPIAMADYYDVLLNNSFGSYRTLLNQVTMHPCMGAYLSHLRNAKEDPANNLFPDENYAREVMQLFTIGLWELNNDGTKKLNASGRPIPTYNNDTIRNFSKVFTGLTLKKTGGSLLPEVRTADYFNWTDNETFSGSMEMWDLENWVFRADRSWITSPEYFHDRTAKTLLNGTVLPAGQRGLKDINDAIDNLIAHQNTGPFIARLLIQRFVTSNPSPAYINRVATVFNANKSNSEQMKFVIKAILLDAEARDPAKLLDPKFGKLREPNLRAANLMKAFNAVAPNGKYELRNMQVYMDQKALNSPSVFNFYQPDYRPPGVLASQNLYAPEFQIMTDSTAILNPNYAHYSLTGWRQWTNGSPTPTYFVGDFNQWGTNYESTDPRHKTDLVQPNYTTEISLASNPEALLQRLDLLMTYGNLSVRQHQIIREALERITQSTHSQTAYPNDYLRKRVEFAAYLISISPEFSIQK